MIQILNQVKLELSGVC